MSLCASPSSSVVSVLLVDDDLDIRDAVADILLERGYSVATAANGAEALDLLGRVLPRVILLDLNMPVMSGAEFREAQRCDSALSRIPTVVLTASPQNDPRLAEIGANGFIGKPFSLTQLLAVVERFCR